MENEGLLAALVDGNPRQVAGHQVSRELHARKVQPEGPGQRMGQGGFADARNVLDQQMPPGQQAGDAVPNLGRFSDDHRVKLVQERFEFLLCIHGVGQCEQP
jgi:hypothetical protein